MNFSLLIEKAYEGQQQAYAPYSNFKVGAAVLAEDEKIYTGCNIENASYGASNCAERTAIFKAVSQGNRKIKAIAIVSIKGDYTYPCGICRQVIAEFATDDLKIILAKNPDEYIIKTVEEIFPNAFNKSSLLKVDNK